MFKSQADSPGQKGITMKKGSIDLAYGQIMIKRNDGSSIVINNKYWQSISPAGEVDLDPWCFGEFEVLYVIFKELVLAIRSGVNFGAVYDKGHVSVTYTASTKILTVHSMEVYETIVMDC